MLKLLTGSGTLGYWVGFALCALCVVVYIVSPDTLEGLVPNIMSALSLFERFYVCLLYTSPLCCALCVK